NIEQLYEEDPENRNAEKIYEYSFKFYFGDKIAGRKNDLAIKENLVIKARSLNEKPVKLQVALVMDNGASFGKIVELDPQLKEYRIPLSRLQPVKTVLLPRPYPTFLPFYFKHEQTAPFDTQRIESLQFSIGPGLGEEQLDEEHGVGIRWVQLQ
ncbi:MAG TPA: hypothetical protein VFM60_00680, partial [Salinimicrobium sp.]|nr:hypothetical protein [Salinimicrobium sp.]